GRDDAPVLERQASPERVFRVERLDRPHELVDFHLQCLRVPVVRLRPPVPWPRGDYRGCWNAGTCHSVTDRSPLDRRPPRTRGDRDLLADTEPTEDRAEQVVGGEAAGDLAERVVRRAQLLGDELERPVAGGGMNLGGLEMPGGPAQRVDMAGTGMED